MRDRQPTPGMEGRVEIIPEDGSPPFFARIVMADQPLDPGDPLNKATLFSDEAAALFGPEYQVPDDAFRYLGTTVPAIIGADAIVRVTVVNQDGRPIRNTLFTVTAGAAVSTQRTNEYGQMSVRISGGGTATISTDCVDVVGSQTVSGASGTISDSTIRFTTLSFLSITESKTIRLSSGVIRLDSTAVGAGAGGGYGVTEYDSEQWNYYLKGGSGGGGGEVITQNNIEFTPHTDISITIGNGGSHGVSSKLQPLPSPPSAAVEPTAGGETIVQQSGKTLLRAAGGQVNKIFGAELGQPSGGGSRDLEAGNGANGTVGYTGFTTQELLSGGGGGGGIYYRTAGSPIIRDPGTGGKPNGGSGGGVLTSYTGSSGLFPGGGGGGGLAEGYSLSSSDFKASDGGDGANGVVNLRVYHWEVELPA